MVALVCWGLCVCHLRSGLDGKEGDLHSDSQVSHTSDRHSHSNLPKRSRRRVNTNILTLFQNFVFFDSSLYLANGFDLKTKNTRADTQIRILKVMTV